MRVRILVTVFFFVILLCLGGLYHAPALAVVAVSVWVAEAVLVVLALLARHGLHVSVRLPEGGVRRLEPFACAVEIQNRSIVPVHRFSVQLRCGVQGEPALVREVSGGVAGRGRVQISLPLTALHVGLLTVDVEQLRVWDLFTFFSFRKKTGDCAQAVLLPALLVMPVALERAALLPAEEDGAPGVLDGAPPEVREIDAYRPGDAMRDVHWKLSARQDTLLTKRYSLETRPRFCVWWELCGPPPQNPGAADAFWTLCYALSAGLLAAEAPHDLCWYDPETQRVEVHRVEDRTELMRLLAAHLRRPKPFSDHPLPDVVRQARFLRADAGETILVVDATPCLYLDEYAVLKLDGEHYVEQIEENRIQL